MATLSTIRNRIKSDLELSGTARDSQIDDAIRSAIRWYNGSQLWFLQKKDAVTLLTGNDSVALPSDFGSLKPRSGRLPYSGIYYSQGYGFDQYTWAELNGRFRSNLTSARPTKYAISGSTLYVDCLADGDYAIELTYFKKDATEPTGDSGTSFWFEEGQDAIRARAMAFFKDEAQDYETAANDWARADAYFSKLIEQSNQYTGII